MHLDSKDRRGGKKPTDCRRNLKVQKDSHGNFTNIESQARKLKIWAILGYRFKCECPELESGVTGVAAVGDAAAGPKCVARSKHMEMKDADLPDGLPWHTLRSLPDMVFTPDERR